MAGASRQGNTFSPKRPTVTRWGKTTLTDEEWQKIANLSGLPAKVRPKIVEVIDVYRSHQANFDIRNKPSSVRRELDELRKSAESLAISLATALNDVDLWSAVARPRPSSNEWPPRTGLVDPKVAVQRITGTLYELQRLRDWLILARAAVPHSKRGSKRQSAPASAAVFMLDEILFKFKKRNLERSNKRNETSEYVKAVLLIADPGIGKGTIDQAIKHQIFHRLQGKIERGSPGVILPRDSGDIRRPIRKTKKRRNYHT
jgi:hypothetical protein